MESIKRGFVFLKQSWQMAFADPDLIKPSFYALGAGLIVTVTGMVLIGGTQFVLGDSSLGQVVVFVLGALFLFAEYATTYLFSAMTIYLIYGYLAEGDGRMDKALAVVRRDFWDILSLAAVSALVRLVTSRRSRRRNRGGILGLLGGLVNLLLRGLQIAWTEATYLILPAMVIEDIGLKDGVQRATRIIRENLLLIGVSMVGVGTVVGLIGFVVVVIGIVLGVGAALLVTSVFGSSVATIVAATAVAVLIIGIFVLVTMVFSSYTTTAYHTCLYLWARDVERAREREQPAEAVPAPAPLAAALG